MTRRICWATSSGGVLVGRVVVETGQDRRTRRSGRIAASCGSTPVRYAGDFSPPRRRVRDAIPAYLLPSESRRAISPISAGVVGIMSRVSRPPDPCSIRNAIAHSNERRLERQQIRALEERRHRRGRMPAIELLRERAQPTRVERPARYSPPARTRPARPRAAAVPHATPPTRRSCARTPSARRSAPSPPVRRRPRSPRRTTYLRGPLTPRPRRSTTCTSWAPASPRARPS